MQRRMAYGEPGVVYKPLIHHSPAGVFCNGYPLTPSTLIDLDNAPLIVATSSMAYRLAIDLAARSVPHVARRWAYWSTLAYNPHCVVISRSLARLYHDPPEHIDLAGAAAALTSASSGVVGALQEGFMARIRASARYARYDAAEPLTAANAARLYRHAVAIASDWSSLVNLDPLASLANVEHGDVGQGNLDAHLGSAWRIRFTHPPKLRPGPVYVRFDAERACEAKLTELSADVRGLWASVTIPKSRSDRLGANPKVGTAWMSQAYAQRATVWLSDRAYISSINLDQLGPWDGTTIPMPPPELTSRDLS